MKNSKPFNPEELFLHTFLTNLSLDNDQIIARISKDEPAYYFVKSDFLLFDVVAKVKNVSPLDPLWQADGAFGGLNPAFFAGKESTAADTDFSAILAAEPRRHLHTSK